MYYRVVCALFKVFEECEITNSEVCW